MQTFNSDIAGFRFRNDDGTEATATYDSTLNQTDYSLDTDTLKRLRILIQETNGGAANNQGFTWQYRHVEGTNTWTSITTSSSVVIAVSSQLVDDADTTTTARIGSGTFITDNNAQCEDGVTTIPAADFAGNDETECELSFQIVNADVSDGDTIDFRVLIGGSAPTTTTQLPTLTANATASTPVTVTPTGVEADGEVGSVTVDISIPVTVVLAINRVDTFYFTGTPIDNEAVWTDDANAADGSTSTFAYGGAGSNFTYFEELLLPDIDRVASGGTITNVRTRAYMSVESVGASNSQIIALVVSDAGTNLRSSAAIGSVHTPGWTTYTAGFNDAWHNWTAINNAVVVFYGNDLVDTYSEGRAYRAELEVSSSASEIKGEVGSVTVVIDYSVQVTGIEATAEVGAVTVDIGTGAVNITVSGIEATGAVGTVTVDIATGPVTVVIDTTVVDTYYFDGTPVDNDSAWADDANAADGSIVTYAYTGQAGDASTNELRLNSSTVPTSGNTITYVRFRFYGSVNSSDANNAKINGVWTTPGVAPSSVSIADFDATPQWSNYVALNTAGNNWSSINALECVIYGEDHLGTFVFAAIYKAELEVTSSASEATGEIGSVTVTAEANTGVTGVEATGEAGEVTVDIGTGGTPVTVIVSGLEAAGELTTVTTAADANVVVSGLEAAGEIDSVSLTSKANVQIRGPLKAVSTFTAADDTLISNYTPDIGNSWVEITTPLGSEPKISGNKLIATDSSTDEWIFDSEVFDGVITVSAHMASGAVSNVSIVFRSIHNTDSQEHYLVNINDDHFNIWRASLISGSQSLGSNYSLGSNFDVIRYIKLVLQGSSIKLYVDDTLLFDLTDSVNATGAYHGVRFFGFNDNWIDEFKVHSFGLEASGEVNSVTVTAIQAPTVAITGLEATGEVGPVTVQTEGNVTVTPTGAEATGEVGLVSVAAVQAPTVLVTGLEATSEFDSVTVTGDANVDVTGLEATGEVDSVSITTVQKPTVLVTGLEATSEFGQVTVDTETSTTVIPVGLEATGEVGSVSVASIQAPTVLVTGLEATSELGQVTVTGDANVAITGLETTGQVGSVTVTTIQVPIVLVAGLEATGELGQVTVQTAGNATVIPTGIEASGEVGSATVAAVRVVTIVPTGVEATTEIGSVTVNTEQAITVAVIGSEATTQISPVTVTGDANVTLVGSEAVGEIGQVVVQTAGNITVPVSSLEALGQVGSVSITGDANVIPIGIQAVGEVGAVTVSASSIVRRVMIVT